MKTALAFSILVAVIAISCTHKTSREEAGLGIAHTGPNAPSKSDDGTGEGEDGDDDEFH